MAVIYFIIIILFLVLFLWIWNNTKDFEDNLKKIKFMVIGIIALVIITFIIFNISKIGITYPNKEVLKQVRRISVLLCVPINGYLSLPHIAKILSDIKNNSVDDEKSKRRIIILTVITIIAIIFEIFYLKDFQKGIIENLMNSAK